MNPDGTQRFLIGSRRDIPLCFRLDDAREVGRLPEDLPSMGRIRGWMLLLHGESTPVFDPLHALGPELDEAASALAAPRFFVAARGERAACLALDRIEGIHTGFEQSPQSDTPPLVRAYVEIAGRARPVIALHALAASCMTGDAARAATDRS